MSYPTIYHALADVMRAVRSVGKDGFNQHDRYKFRGIDGVVNAVGPALRDAGVFVIPDVRSYEYGSVVVGKNRTEMGHARVVVAYTFYGPAGDSVVASAPGEAFDSGDKATAKAMSVAFRTALLQSLALPTDDPDPDTQSYERAPAREQTANPRTALLAEIKRLAPSREQQVQIYQEWLSDHDEAISDTTDIGSLELLRDDLKARADAAERDHKALVKDTLATERPAERLQGPDPVDPWEADNLPTPTETANT